MGGFRETQSVAVPLLLTGGVITDAQRVTARSWGINQQGSSTDGLTPPAGFYIGDARTNLFRRGQCDAIGVGGAADSKWISQLSASVLIDEMTPAPFSPQSIEVATPGAAAGEGCVAVTATGLAAAAGTVGAGSIWFKGVAAQTYNVYLLWLNTDASATAGTILPVTASGNWQMLIPPPLAVAAGKTGDRLQFDVLTSTRRAESFHVAHAQLEKGVPFVGPYIATSGGATATRNAARIQALASLLNAKQAGISLRLQPGWNSGTALYGISTPIVFMWANDASNYIAIVYTPSTNLFTLRSVNGGTVSSVSAPAVTFNSGDGLTITAQWNATTLKLSVNGAAFSSAARGIIPTLTASLFDLGCWTPTGTFQIDGNYRWAATFADNLTDTNAATLNNFGNIPPNLFQLPGEPTYVTPCITSLGTAAVGNKGRFREATALRGGFNSG